MTGVFTGDMKFGYKTAGYRLLFVALAFLLLCPVTGSAASKVFNHTIDQPFAGSQSPDDAYMAAITRAKFEVLEQAGTYLESLTVVENATLTKDEVTALAGGILTTEVVGRENYATEQTFGIRLTVHIEMDSDTLRQRMEKLLQDRTLLHKYDEIHDREQELLTRIRELEAAVRNSTTATRQPEDFSDEFTSLSAALTASQWLEKAFALWNNGQFTDPARAVDYLTCALNLDPKNPRIHNSRAVGHLKMGKFTEAETDLKTALAQAPEYADAHNNLGHLLFRRGEFDKAIAAFTLAVEYRPDFVEAIVNRGMTAQKLGNFEDAFNDFHRAMLLAPSALATGNENGSLVELNDFSEMCAKAQTACRMGLCRAFDSLRQRGFCRQESPDNP